jgi:hypothetical protein
MNTFGVGIRRAKIEHIRVFMSPNVWTGRKTLFILSVAKYITSGDKSYVDDL